MLSYIIAYTALMITLIYASWLDHKYRRIPHRTWIPLILISLLPMITIWLDLWPSQILCITFVLCVIVYLMPIWFPGNPENPYQFSFHGADAIALILITLIKPVTLGCPTLVYLLIAACSIFTLAAACLPNIKKSWDERGIPFLVPLTPAAALMLILPV